MVSRKIFKIFFFIFNDWGLFAPLLFFILMIIFFPLGQMQEFDTDEGINLIKSLLFLKGYSMYSEIWSDQPPVLTILMAWAFKITGPSVLIARLIIVTFSTLLLFFFYKILRLSSISKTISAASIIVLIFSHRYIRLSGSVMIGLPALSLAIISIYFLMLSHYRSRSAYILISSFVMTLSVFTKLNTMFLVPLFFFFLLIINDKTRVRDFFVSTFLWISVFFIFGLLFVFHFNLLSTDQLISPHLMRNNAESFLMLERFMLRAQFFLSHIYYIPFTLIGLYLLFKRKDKKQIFPFLWLLLYIPIIFFHNPLWYHHLTLLVIPFTWIFAYSLEGLIRFLRKGSSRYLAFCSYCFLLIMALLFIYLPNGFMLKDIPSTQTGTGFIFSRTNNSIFDCRPSFSFKLLESIKSHIKTKNDLIMTDRPIYAFYSNIRVPPQLAVISAKRLSIGELTKNTLFEILKKRKPEHVLIQRFINYYNKEFFEFLNKNYDLNYFDEKKAEKYFTLKNF